MCYYSKRSCDQKALEIINICSECDTLKILFR